MRDKDSLRVVGESLADLSVQLDLELTCRNAPLAAEIRRCSERLVKLVSLAQALLDTPALLYTEPSYILPIQAHWRTKGGEVVALTGAGDLWHRVAGGHTRMVHESISLEQAEVFVYRLKKTFERRRESDGS